LHANKTGETLSSLLLDPSADDEAEFLIDEEDEEDKEEEQLGGKHVQEEDHWYEGTQEDDEVAPAVDEGATGEDEEEVDDADGDDNDEDEDGDDQDGNSDDHGDRGGGGGNNGPGGGHGGNRGAGRPDDDQAGPSSGGQDELSRLRQKSKLRPPSQIPRWAKHTALAADALIEPDPNSYKEVMASSQSYRWQDAMQDEMSSHQANNTWELVEKPPGAKILDNRWVY
jgi:hypothetical protein